MKNITLDFIGYEIRGEAELLLWGGGQGSIEMAPCFIAADELTHNRIKTCTNDNGFGCKSILGARVDIYKVYGQYPYYKEYNRTIELDHNQCDWGLKGIYLV